MAFAGRAAADIAASGVARLEDRVRCLVAPPRRHIRDLGGVLIEWNPRNLYRKLFVGDENAMSPLLRRELELLGLL
jgi:hypothetical protein